MIDWWMIPIFYVISIVLFVRYAFTLDSNAMFMIPLAVCFAIGGTLLLVIKVLNS